MDRIRELFKRNKFLKTGLPFFILVLGGPFVLQMFGDIKYKYKIDSQKVTPEQMAELGITMKSEKEITLEGEYEKVKKMDIDNWKQIRGPRPWEEDFGENQKQ